MAGLAELESVPTPPRLQLITYEVRAGQEAHRSSRDVFSLMRAGNGDLRSRSLHIQHPLTQT